jgi:hypothetical protein
MIQRRPGYSRPANARHLTRSRLGAVSRTSVPRLVLSQFRAIQVSSRLLTGSQSYFSTPTHAVSTPSTLAGSFAPSESVSRSSQAVSIPSLDVWALPSPGAAWGPFRARATSVLASRQRAPESQAARVPSYLGPFARLPRVTGLRPHSPPAGPALGQALSIALSGPPRAEPDQGPRLRHRGLLALAHKAISCG